MSSSRVSHHSPSSMGPPDNPVRASTVPRSRSASGSRSLNASSSSSGLCSTTSSSSAAAAAPAPARRRLTDEERAARDREEERLLLDGPCRVLAEAVRGGDPVLVHLRNDKKLVAGRVLAYDRHLNLVLGGVRETWLAAAGDASCSTAGDGLVKREKAKRKKTKRMDRYVG